MELQDEEEEHTGTDTSILMFDGDAASTETEFPEVDSGFDEEDAYADDDDAFDAEFYEADDEAEFEAEESRVGLVAPGGPAMRASEAPWGAGVTAGVMIGSVFSAVGAIAGFELVRTMWMWLQPGGGESGFLLFVGGLFG